jgi:hypothetical protein
MYEHMQSAEERLDQLRWSDQRLVLPETAPKTKRARTSG